MQKCKLQKFQTFLMVEMVPEQAEYPKCLKLGIGLAVAYDQLGQESGSLAVWRKLPGTGYGTL